MKLMVFYARNYKNKAVAGLPLICQTCGNPILEGEKIELTCRSRKTMYLCSKCRKKPILVYQPKFMRPKNNIHRWHKT